MNQINHSWRTTLKLKYGLRSLNVASETAWRRQTRRGFKRISRLYFPLTWRALKCPREKKKTRWKRQRERETPQTRRGQHGGVRHVRRTRRLCWRRTWPRRRPEVGQVPRRPPIGCGEGVCLGRSANQSGGSSIRGFGRKRWVWGCERHLFTFYWPDTHTHTRRTLTRVAPWGLLMSGVVTPEMYSRSQPGIEERKRKCVQVLIDFGKVLSTYSGFFFWISLLLCSVFFNLI